MRIFPPVRVRDVGTPASENHLLGFAGGSSFVLGPGYQVIEGGQLPQVLPGQPHDGLPPASSNPQAVFPLSASETVQSAAVVLSPLASVAPSGSQQLPSIEPAASTSAQLSSSAQVSLYDALLELFECLGNFLKRLEIYMAIPPTPMMADIIVQIMVELLSVLALATKQVKQGRFSECVITCTLPMA
jgi:hypothetical protein